MTLQVHITGSRTKRPRAERIIFCDGSADESFRDGIDLELSHWIPNRTPARFKADTSTEICLNFLNAREDGYDLAVNNHVDVDGVLSTFVLAYPDAALAHRDTLVQAAVIGDFWGWGERPGQELYEALALAMSSLVSSGTDPQEIYPAGFECALAVLSRALPPDVEAGIAALTAAVARIESGEIARTGLNPRFVHYAVPRALAERDLAAALLAPSAFNVSLARQGLLPPQARARLDAERIQLVSVETENGWFYDLWYPGYIWAETPNRWRPSGVESIGDSNAHRFHHERLLHAVDQLKRMETGLGQWTVANRFSPFYSLKGRSFPIVLSVLCEGSPAPSLLPPATVVNSLAQAFAED